MLDLLLVNPNDRKLYGELAFSLSGIEPPFWCALLASFTREKGYTVKILDAVVENLSVEETADRVVEENPLLTAIIAMGQNPSCSSTPKMTAVGEIIRVLKEKDSRIKIIVGGLHPSALPEKTLSKERPDFICQGEGFNTIAELLFALKQGNTRPIIPGLWYRDGNVITYGGMADLVDVDSLPMPAWDLLPMEKYRAHNWHCLSDLDNRSPYGVIFTSLGCPFNCSFCNIHALYDGKPGIRFRNPKRVIEEIDFLVRNYSIKNFKIWDEIFALREDRINQICDLLIERDYGLNIWAYARVDTVNRLMLKKMKQAGINWVAYGFESANELVRRGVAKKFHQDTIIRAVEMTRVAGIYIIGNFIFGFPDDDLRTMQETLEMAKEFNFEWLNLYVAMPYPGSQLYNEAIRQGAKLPGRWANWGQYSERFMPLPTKYLSGKAVLEFRDKAFQEYFSRDEYLRMIEKKFGSRAVEHIKEMLRYKVR